MQMSLWSVMPIPAAFTPAAWISSWITWLYRKSSTPPPPCASGAAKPRNPAAPAARNTSRSMIPSRSNSSFRGTISLSRNCRNEVRKSSCSSSKMLRCTPCSLRPLVHSGYYGRMLDDIVVLDLSWGVAGPMAGMLLADRGARVTRILPPGGDPYESSGSRVWGRGKHERTLDLKADADRAEFLALADAADVVIESWSPGTAARLGVDHTTLLARNPRLVHCSITGYGDTKDADRPGIDALVAARTGQLFESRGTVGTTIARI